MVQKFANNYVSVEINDVYATVELIGTGFALLQNKNGKRGPVVGSCTAVKFTTTSGDAFTGNWPQANGNFGDGDKIIITGPKNVGDSSNFTFTSDGGAVGPVVVTVKQTE